jgi:hypothetical protein
MNLLKALVGFWSIFGGAAATIAFIVLAIALCNAGMYAYGSLAAIGALITPAFAITGLVWSIT